MKSIEDSIYKGQEIIIMQQDDNKFTVDVREDNFDGDILMGWCDVKSYKEAKKLAKDFIDSQNRVVGRCKEKLERREVFIAMINRLRMNYCKSIVDKNKDFIVLYYMYLETSLTSLYELNSQLEIPTFSEDLKV